MKYFILIFFFLCILSCKTPQLIQQEHKQTTTIIERLVDTAIRIPADSLLSAYQYNTTNGGLEIKPLWKFGSSVLDNVLKIDTTNKMIYINTIKHDTFIKIQYKNIHTTDSVYIKVKEPPIYINQLNGWQKFMINSAYVFYILLLIFIGLKIAKIYLKTQIPFLNRL